MSALLEIKGLAPLVQSLRNWEGVTEREVRRAQAAARQTLVTRLTDYPPPPPRSTYQRTERLKRGWERAVPVATKAGALQFVNPVEYADVVQVAAKQAHVHRGRWTTIEEIAHEEEEPVLALYEAAYERAAQKVSP